MKTMVSEGKQCPNCGGSMPAGALAGLCPACLLAQGAQAEPAGSGGSKRFEPPPFEEVVKLFPQLEVVGLLGAGGMGAVYKARQPALDRFVALKILPASNTAGQNFTERFNREARALARLSHPNIVAVHEFGQAGQLHYFLMEFVDGANLRQLERAGVLSPREALQIIPQICDALQYAHDEGVVHRDIKPENVLVDRKGRVKIADFGLAKIAGAQTGSTRLTLEGDVMGTPHYMAPEQVERPLAVDHRADIYALGVVFYEMLTGDLPLGKFAPPSCKVEVDVRFDEVVLRALENDPARRYQNASEVKSEVQSIAATPPPALGVPKPDERFFSWFGFAVVVERAGKRELNWKGVLTAFGVIFGLLTIAFGFVSAISGRSLLGWIGVVGWKSVVARCIIAVLAVTWGVRRTMRSKSTPEPLPQTPRGTVIVPSARRRWHVGRRLVFASVLVLLWCVFQFRWLTPRLQARSGRPSAAQVATRNSATGNLIAKLPGRGTVELLAVGKPHHALNRWWSPNGRPLNNTLYEVRGGIEGKSDRRISKDILFRVTDLPDGASSGNFEAFPASGGGSGGAVFLNGTAVRGGVQVQMAWEPSVSTASIYLGYGLKPWRTIATRGATSQSHEQRRFHGDPAWTVNFHQVPTDTKEGAQIAVIFGPEDRMWTHRVIAVDTNDVEHPVNLGNGTPIEKLTLWTYTFYQLPLAAVKEFRFQVRPVHWVEFRDVALVPDAPMPPPRYLRFGPVHEQSPDQAIDLDRGKVTDLAIQNTTSLVDPEVRRSLLEKSSAQLQKEGVDFIVGAGELRVLDMDFTVLDNSDWDDIRPHEIGDRIYRNHYRPREVKPLKEGQLPATFGFRTREQNLGILQLLPFDDPVSGATMRYKLVERPMLQQHELHSHPSR
jgi:hypothetical protein